MIVPARSERNFTPRVTGPGSLFQGTAGVAELFQKTFRNPRKTAPASLTNYIEQIFLNHPWQDKDQVSKVVIDADSKACPAGAYKA